jgi:membrane glycosyltransferase
VIADMLLSILMAPVSMLTQTINLLGILMGRKSAWNGQTRDRDGMAIWSAVWLFKWHILLGAGLTTIAVLARTPLGWMVPVVAGLVLAPVLAAVTARKDLGHAADSLGLFRVAEPWWRSQNYRPLRHRRLTIQSGGPIEASQAAANDG